MVTCCSMGCPFVNQCKDYNFLVDRTGGCETQQKLIDTALKLVISKELNKKEVSDKKMQPFNVILESSPSIDSLKVKKFKVGGIYGNGKLNVDFYFE